MVSQIPNTVAGRINLFSKVNKTAAAFQNANPLLQGITPIDLNDDEVIGFLKSMAAQDVVYLLVGGFAMAFHGYIPKRPSDRKASRQSAKRSGRY